MMDTVFSGVILVYSLFLKTVVFSFNLSYFVGQLIVWSILTIYSLLKNTVYAIQTLLQVLCEDCLVFLSDVASKFSFISELLVTFTEAIGQTLNNVVNAVVDGIDALSSVCVNFFYSINNLSSLFLHSIRSACVLLKDSLVLVGSTSWTIFTFIPTKIVVFKNFIVSMTLLGMKETRNVITILQVHLYKTFDVVTLFITDIPQESICGLCLSVLLGWVLVKYWQHIYPSSMRYFGCVIHQSHRSLLIAWNYLETFTLWLLTNQTNTAFPPTNNYPANAQRNAIPEGIPLKRNDPDASQSQLDGNAVLEQECSLCVVCQAEERCTIILPCRHVCLCYDCCAAIKRTHGRCPICRHAVRRTMRVYI